MKKINIKAKRSPARRHVRFLKTLEKQSFLAYRIAMRMMIEELRQHLVSEKLMKSNKLGTGWTGAVPTISLDLNSTISKTVGKYMQALRWIMTGDFAGKEARKMAKKLGFVDKMVPGIMQASYLDSLDMHREHYVQVFETAPVDIPKLLLEGSIDKISERTERYINQVTNQLENNIINALDRIVENFNYQNTNTIHKKATDAIESGEDSEDALEAEVNEVRTHIPKSWFDKELKQAVNNYMPNWKRTVSSELGLSSAAATHQAMHEIYGSNTGSVKVIVLTSKDDRVCNFCKTSSAHPNGEFKYYDMADFKPSGWNIGKKRNQWVLSIPSFHPNCRCILIYVPDGFKVTSDGELIPE